MNFKESKIDRHFVDLKLEDQSYYGNITYFKQLHNLVT